MSPKHKKGIFDVLLLLGKKQSPRKYTDYPTSILFEINDIFLDTPIHQAIPDSKNSKNRS